jgi:signal transduction histidine kinase
LFQTIRWRLAASYALLVLLSVTLMGALALSIVQRYVTGQERESLQRNAEAVAEEAGLFFSPQLRRVALEQLAYASAFLGNARVRILDAVGGVIADSGDPGLPDEFLWVVPSDLEEMRQEVRPSGAASIPQIIPLPRALRTGRSITPRSIIPYIPFLRDNPFGTGYAFAHRVLTPWGPRFDYQAVTTDELTEGAEASPSRQYVTTTVAVNGMGGVMGSVELSGPLSLSGETLRPVRNAVFLSGLGSLIVAIVFGLFLGRTIADPLRDLAATARRMGDGDLGARASGTRRDEIGQLAGQFNGMAQRLQASFEALRLERDSLKRFVADASHELRTPITALATFNELLQGSAADDAPARQEFLRESAAQLARLQWITTNLLDLSRLDAGIAALAMAEHPAGDLLQAATAGSRTRASEKNVTIAITLPEPPFTVRCDRNWMEIALANLVSNAVKFLPPGGTVSAGVTREGGTARFTVRDNGPGIAPDDLPRIFERFYRGRIAGDGAGAEAGGNASQGAGLGLAIVRSVANAHGGRIEAASTVGAGSIFTLEIPAGT